MRNLWFHFAFVLCLIGISIWSILPTEDKLRRGKDLAGGVSLVYQVELKPDDPDNTVPRMIDLLKRRVDPSGVLDITMVRQGGNRIEVTMPLPGEKVKALRAEFEAALAKISSGALTAEQFERLMKVGSARAAEIKTIAGDDAARLELLEKAGQAHDMIAVRTEDFRRRQPELRSAVDAATAALNNMRQTGAAGEALAPLEQGQRDAQGALDGLAKQAAETEIAYTKAREAALATAIPATEVRRALQLGAKDRSIRSEATGEQIRQDSPRKQATARLVKNHPAASTELDEVVATWNNYEKNRSTLDDPSDLKRLLRGAGVLEIRIASNSMVPDEDRLRAELRQNGPRAVRSNEFAWFKINKLESWYDSAEELKELTDNPAAYFRSKRSNVAEVYDGEIYVLLYTVGNATMLAGTGEWKVAGARFSQDGVGRPAIAFTMNDSGALRLRELTANNKGRPMAVLLDDEIYTIATIQEEIGKQGQITGTFSNEEVNYVVRVLEAGSLAAKLSPEPISENTIGPELGQDNLDRGLYAGVVSFLAVAAFMICYYFTGGGIAIIALMINLLMILAAMSLNSAKFSLPGIAGVILTFGMAVDANVLIYERMREELMRGNDLRTAVRLAYSKALSAILDGNNTILIVCIVLTFTGTPEIKGFAITMTIGTITTMICQLYIARLMNSFVVDKLKWKKMSMLPLAIPALNRILHPNINWLRYTTFYVIFSVGLTLLSIAIIYSRGADLLDNEFRGGTKVTIALKTDPATGKPLTRTRAEIQQRLEQTIDELVAKDAELVGLQQMNPGVIMLNPQDDRSSRFIIKTTMTDTQTVTKAVTTAFADDLDMQESVAFAGSDEKRTAEGRVLPITVKGSLRENFETTAFAALAGMEADASDYVGGGALFMTDINAGQRRPTKAMLENRLSALANDPEFASAVARRHRIIVLDGDDTSVTAAAVLFIDPQIKFESNAEGWKNDVRGGEWKFVTTAMSRETTLAGMESFSPSIAATFAAQAIVATLLSAVLIIIYVWIRFSSFRYSLAAMAATLHDCIVAVGAIAASSYALQLFPGFAEAIGLRDFKIDLNVVAAVLTILGYSLNDTIVIMDRIRETKGKSPFASIAIVNQSINETVSRTLITSGLTIAATLVLYIFGGEAVRAFAFCFLVGVLTGTYSSVAVAGPIVAAGRGARNASGTNGRSDGLRSDGLRSDGSVSTPALPA